MDYRLKENRKEYFEKLYSMNLEYRVMPGLVYLYFPEISRLNNLTNEQKLWFATINGFTQSPITTNIIFNELPDVPTRSELKKFSNWFNDNWTKLHFDADRLKNKRNTIKGIESYIDLVEEYGNQVNLWDSKNSYSELWSRANKIYSMGRLSCFSYLEYIKIMGYGTDCDDLMFYDLNGSRSHRNGWLFFTGRDNEVFDKRIDNSATGKYEPSFLTETLPEEAKLFLKEYNTRHNFDHANNYTLESQCCQFKNGFFGRRYPGVYSDMAYDRIKFYDNLGMSSETKLFKDIRLNNLPEWLLEEKEKQPVCRRYKATLFKETGVPYRSEYFLNSDIKFNNL